MSARPREENEIVLQSYIPQCPCPRDKVCLRAYRESKERKIGCESLSISIARMLQHGTKPAGSQPSTRALTPRTNIVAVTLASWTAIGPNLSDKTDACTTTNAHGIVGSSRIEPPACPLEKRDGQREWKAGHKLVQQ